MPGFSEGSFFSEGRRFISNIMCFLCKNIKECILPTFCLFWLAKGVITPPGYALGCFVHFEKDLYQIKWVMIASFIKDSGVN